MTSASELYEEAYEQTPRCFFLGGEWRIRVVTGVVILNLVSMTVKWMRESLNWVW